MQKTREEDCANGVNNVCMLRETINMSIHLLTFDLNNLYFPYLDC